MKRKVAKENAENCGQGNINEISFHLSEISFYICEDAKSDP
ncbi:MAG TPA: hypothetical protein VEY68_08975 [Anoxybacillus sp.]|nr:hypothetical protein [Anoxybacillus sp.]